MWQKEGICAEDWYQQSVADWSGARTIECRKACTRTGTNKVLRIGVVPGIGGRSKAPGMASTQREVLLRHLASAAGKKPSVSLALFLEINNLDVEHELTCAAACFWAQSV